MPMLLLDGVLVLNEVVLQGGASPVKLLAYQPPPSHAPPLLKPVNWPEGFLKVPKIALPCQRRHNIPPACGWIQLDGRPAVQRQEEAFWGNQQQAAGRVGERPLQKLKQQGIAALVPDPDHCPQHQSKA